MARQPKEPSKKHEAVIGSVSIALVPPTQLPKRVQEDRRAGWPGGRIRRAVTRPWKKDDVGRAGADERDGEIVELASRKGLLTRVGDADEALVVVGDRLREGRGTEW